jgi:hypothetical protein
LPTAAYAGDYDRRYRRWAPRPRFPARAPEDRPLPGRRPGTGNPDHVTRQGVRALKMRRILVAEVPHKAQTETGPG